MATTRWGQVLDALVTQIRAQPGYRGLDGATGVVVLDSIEAWQTELLTDTYLVVGWTDPDGNTESGTADQDFATRSATRDESGTVRCRAVAQPGTVDPKSARDAALAVVATVEGILRADPTLGLVAAPTAAPRMVAAIGSRMTFGHELRRGAVCSIDFDVVYSTRI